MKAQLSRILALGRRPNLPPWENRRIRLTNVAAVVSIVSILTFVIMYLVLDFQKLWPAAAHALIFLPIFILVFYLNHKGLSSAAKLFQGLGITAVVLITTGFGVGKGPGMHYYFFIFAVVPAIIWSIRQWPLILGFFLLNLGSFFYVELAPLIKLLPIDLPAEHFPLFRVFSLVTSFATITALLVLFQHTVEVSEVQLEAQNQTMAQQNQLKDRLFTVIAHDLRNPFGSLFLSLDTLRLNQESMSQEELKEWLETMGESGNRIKGLLERLLDWAGQLVASSSPITRDFEIKPILKQELDMAQEQAQKKSQTLTLYCPDKVLVHADPDMAASVVRNLLANALKFTPPGGKITIRAHFNSKQRLEISVEDSGVGIDEKTMENLLLSGRKDSHPGTENEVGSGLGLILCRDFSRKNGGELKITTHPGQGSVFTFDLEKSHGNGWD